MELLRELYWEAKRAPQPKIAEIRNPYKRESVRKKLLGKTKAERLQTIKGWNELIEKRKIEIEAEELGLKNKPVEAAETDPLKIKRAQRREQARKRFVKGKEVEHLTRLDFLE